MMIPEHFAVPSMVDLALYTYNPFPDVKFLLHFLLLQRHTLFKAVQCHHAAIFWRFGPKNPAKRAPELVRNPGLLFQLTALFPCSAWAPPLPHAALTDGGGYCFSCFGLVVMQAHQILAQRWIIENTEEMRVGAPTNHKISQVGRDPQGSSHVQLLGP